MSNVARVEQHQELAAPAQMEGATLLSVISRAAADPGTDVEKMERLMLMYERVEAKRAESSFNDAMSDAQARMRTIGADANNPQTRSKYASYGKLDKALRPIYTDNGFSLSFDTGNDAPEGCVRVLCYVSHKAGHSRTYHVDMPADGKGAKGGDVMTKTHAVGAGMSYGMRYLLKMIFNVAVGEEDVDGNDPEQQVDVSDWYAAIDSAVDMTALNALANELKAAGLKGAALRNVRAAWAKRSKEVAQ
jgi:hypothetical protein